MKRINLLTCAAVAAMAVTLAPGTQAQTLQVLTAGSSAQFGTFAVAAYNLAKAGGATAFHYTVKSGACPKPTASPSVCYAYINDDSRSTAIPFEPANIWVVWSTNGIWAYASVDSTVGVRSFLAYPRARLSLGTQPATSATSNYNFWGDGTADTTLTTAVISALNGKALTAANTDIRPEDALFATNRSLNTLGYGSVADGRTGHAGQFLIGSPIKSAFGSGTATPVSFNLTADGTITDPISGQTIPAANAFTTIPVGAAPIVFLANAATGSATASATNVSTTNAASIFSGTSCSSSLLTGATTGAFLNAVLREPLSGTMNTTEYSVFVPGGHSQETGLSNSTNPVNLACTDGGKRFRAIGTGDEVKAVQNSYSATVPTSNAVGYSFFSFESTGNSAAYKYITLDSKDPINTSYSNGALPTCPVVGGQFTCPVVGGTSFPSLRNGSYTAWSVYRLITDATGQSAASTLVAKAESLVNSNIPDFVPFDPQCATTTTVNGATNANDPGLDVYRAHYIPSTITTTPNTISLTANDGPRNTTNVSCSVIRGSLAHLSLGGGPLNTNGGETGGDVGGTIEGPFSATSLPAVPGPTQAPNH
jgi:hypothetical protein